MSALLLHISVALMEILRNFLKIWEYSCECRGQVKPASHAVASEAPEVGPDSHHYHLTLNSLLHFHFTTMNIICNLLPCKIYTSTCKGLLWCPYCHGAGPEFDITEFEMLNVEQCDSVEPSSALTLKPTPIPRSISNLNQPLSPPEPSQDKPAHPPSEAPEVPKDSEKEGGIPANSAQLGLLKRRAPEVAPSLDGWLVVCLLGCWWPGYY